METNKPTIRAALLDYGGVVTADSGFTPIAEMLAKATDIDIERIREVFWGELFPNLMRGKITVDELWRQFEAKFNVAVRDEDRAVWVTADESTPDKKMVALIAHLRQNGIKVGLVSNVLEDLADELRARGIYDQFDFAILSCEIGYAKPDNEFYEHALAELPGIDPSEIVFVDDVERNLAPATKLGMKTILAVNVDKTIVDINATIG